MTTYTTWDRNFSKHPIHSILKQTNDLLKITKEQLGLKRFPEDAFEIYFKISSAISYIEKSLKKNVKTELLSIETLSHIQNTLEIINSKLSDFQNNADIESLIKINHDIDNLLLPDINLLFDPHINAQMEEHKYLTDGLYSKVVTLQKQVEKIDVTIERQKDRLDSSIDQFKQNSQKLTEEWTDKLHEYDKGLEAMAYSLHSKVAGTHEEYIAALEEYKKQAQEIVHTISGASLTNEYQSTANRAEYTMWMWQFITAGLLVYMIYTGYLFDRALSNVQEFIWSQFLPKVILISVIGLAVKYSINQVQYYQTLAQRNRKMQLELKSLDPYLAVFKQEEANNLRAKLAENYFVGQNGETKKEKTNPELEHWLKPLIDLIKDLLKKKPID